MKPQSSLLRCAARAALLAAASLAAACSSMRDEPLVHPTASPRADLSAAPASREPGAIFYQTGGQGMALFEDRRPRQVGDILTIVISENVNATKNSSTNASRTGAASVAFGTTPKLLAGLLGGQDLSMSGANTLAAKGGANATNTFNGVLTVTVVDVLRNGNLVVSGEKQMLINQGTEFIRFSGVVNPQTVTGASTVLSTQVADAKIEYSGKGYINDAETMGWMQRFFLKVLPF